MLEAPLLDTQTLCQASEAWPVDVIANDIATAQAANVLDMAVAGSAGRQVEPTSMVGQGTASVAARVHYHIGDGWCHWLVDDITAKGRQVSREAANGWSCHYNSL